MKSVQSLARGMRPAPSNVPGKSATKVGGHPAALLVRLTV